MDSKQRPIDATVRTAVMVAGALCITVIMAACGTAAKDPTAGWSPEKLYAEAKDEQSAGNFDKSIKMFEQLEGRASGTLLAQQAQLERAFLLFKTGEKAQALSTIERFIKLHPTSPAIDYAMYLRGLINFNDNLGFLGNLSRQNLSERDQQALARRLSVIQAIGRPVPSVEVFV